MKHLRYVNNGLAPSIPSVDFSLLRSALQACTSITSRLRRGSTTILRGTFDHLLMMFVRV